MKRLASIVALLLLLSAAAPMLACMTGGAMSPDENACCRSMHGNCGEMTKTGCCRAEAKTNEQPQIAMVAPSLVLQLAVIHWLTPAFDPVRTVSSLFLDIPADHSPPGLIVAKTTVFRI